MNATVIINITRPCLVNGQRHEIGATLKVDALTAGALIDAGKAELVHAPDAELLRQAARDRLALQMREVGREYHRPYEGDPRWQVRP